MVTTQDPRATAFPADWNDGIEAGITLTPDPMHFPYPLAPLTQSTIGPAFEVGYPAAARELKLPIDRFVVRHQNYYRYDAIVFVRPASDTEARQMAETAEAALKVEMGRQMTRWHDEHLPALRLIVQRLQALDPVNASPDEVEQMLDEADAMHRDLWTIHFRIALVMLVSMQLFDEFHTDVFAGTESDAHALLVGRPSASIKAGIGLSTLAARARALGLEPIFATMSGDALKATLATTDEGRQWLTEMDGYLDEYGLRQDMFDLAIPTWREEPAIAMSSVANYLVANHDAQAEHDATVQSAEAALRAAREQLAAYPEAVSGQFEAMLQFARDAAFLQEEHNFHIDQRGLSALRLFYVKVGQRLVRDGVIDEADEVFMLHVDELHKIVSGDADTATVRALVARRRGEMDIARTLTTPPFIGDPPAGGPPASNPLVRAVMRFFGGPPQQSDVPGQLKGTPGSKGVATGIARVARTLDDARHLEPGEVLVAVTTLPAWTPLFGIAAAVVTETGGALSHCAIVAREYAIPAVVGTYGATSTITNGQRITVDGNRGVVVLSEQE